MELNNIGTEEGKVKLKKRNEVELFGDSEETEPVPAKEIMVRDREFNLLSYTYEKRARQLVKKGRAVWLDSQKTSICILDASGEIDTKFRHTGSSNADFKEDEEMDMDYTVGNGVNPSETNTDIPVSKGYKVIDDRGGDAVADDAFYAYAKKRLKRRYNLVMHIASYIVVNALLSMLVNNFWLYDIRPLVTLIISGWGIGLILHVVHYFAAITPDKIDKECRKISKHLK